MNKVFPSSPAFLLLLLAFLTLAPIFLMMLTSFVKLSVVFSILRSALGTQQVPPNIVIMGISLILTIYIMSPVGEEIWNGINNELKANAGKDTWEIVEKGWRAGSPALRRFILENSHSEVLGLFSDITTKMRERKGIEQVSRDSFIVIIPSFVISELKEAFEIGFVIFLPFLVLDMLIASILVSMGMHMLSPVTISLPFKLLLFVMVNGWELLSRSLILGYRV